MANGFLDYLAQMNPLRGAATFGDAPAPAAAPGQGPGAAGSDPNAQPLPDYVQAAIADQMRQQAAQQQNAQARQQNQRPVGAPFPTPQQAGFTPGPARYPLLNGPGSPTAR